MPLDIGRLHADSQSEIVENATAKEYMKEEYLDDHLLCEYGFCTIRGGELVRMDEDVLERTVRTILQSRPSGRVFDVKPIGGKFKEKVLMSFNPVGYRMTFQQKAEVIARELSTNHLAHGFKITLEGLDVPNTKPSVSMSVYELEEDPFTVSVPVSIFIRYRANW